MNRLSTFGNDLGCLKNLRRWCETAEQKIDYFGKSLEHVIPYVGRFLLTSTYLEDSLRMYFQWRFQKQYLIRFRHMSHFSARLFLFINIALQLFGTSAILVRRLVPQAIACLALVPLYQAYGYHLWSEGISFWSRIMSLYGGLALLLAEYMIFSEKIMHSKVSTTSTSYFAEGIFANTTRGERDKKRRAVLQLCGRILLIFLFLSVVFGGDNFSWIWSVKFSNKRTLLTWLVTRLFFATVVFIICLMVVIGFKARLSATICVAFLSVSNFALNSWWSVNRDNPMRDFYKYDFFQTLSVMGGFLLLMNVGPGKMSLDEKKKIY